MASFTLTSRSRFAVTRPSNNTIPWDKLFTAAGRSDVDAALRKTYEAIERDIAERNPTCWLSGKCCHFDSYGHRLYVTALEAAWVLKQEPTPAIEADPTQLDGCVFQRNKLCGVHAIRPLGCRVFFCDPSATWQNDVYEMHLKSLRALHERFDLPYHYLEWRVALDEARRSRGAM